MKRSIIAAVSALIVSAGAVICAAPKWKVELDMLKCDDF